MRARRTYAAILAALLAGCTPPGAGPKITRGGFIACESEQVFRELLRARATSDERYIELLLTGRFDVPVACYEMDSGDRVTAVDSGWILQDLRIVRWVKFRNIYLPPIYEIHWNERSFWWTDFDSLEDVPKTARADTPKPDHADASPDTVTQFVIEDGKLVETVQVDRDTLKSSPINVIRDGKVVEVIPPETTTTWVIRDGKYVEVSQKERETLGPVRIWVKRDGKYVEAVPTEGE